MAARTGTSFGMGVAITVLGVLALALFVLTTIFFGKYNKAQTELRNAQADTEQFIKSSERNQDDIRRLVEQSRQASKSLVGYLAETQQGVMRRVTGSAGDSLTSLEQRLSTVKGSDTAPLLGLISDLQSQNDNLRNAVEKAEADRKTALADKQAEVDRVKSIESRHQETVNALNAEVGQYKAEVERYRQGADDARSNMEGRVSKLASDNAAQMAQLQDRLRKLQEENLVLQGQISQLRGDKNREIFKGKDEFALVDGRVVGLTPADNAAVIGIGRAQKVVVGMTFSVFTDAAAIRPDDKTGEYPPGKAALEVIRVDDNTSTCRIVWQVKGNPVVAGDVIANPVYDPTKVYKFLVYGNFDANGDGVETPAERADLQAQIEAWGGKVTDELTGDVDFLVLGAKPILPPRPTPDSPIEIMQEYIRLDRIAKRYDELYRQAMATGVPILNENRLNTLLGRDRVGRR